MTIELDRRTRSDADRIELDAATLLDETLPALLTGPNAELAAAGAAALGLAPLALTVEDRAVTLDTTGGGLVLRPGDDAPTAVTASAYALSRVLTDQTSPAVLQLEGEVVAERGPVDGWISWEPVFQALLNGRAVYTPGSLELVDREGAPLDVRRTFTPEDDHDEIGHFLLQAGFLHLRRVVTGDVLDELTRAVDDAYASARPGDDDARTNVNDAGEEVVVGLADFAARWAPISGLLTRELGFLATVAPGTSFDVPPTGNVQHKAFDIARGFANTPWHRDCGPGGHSYRCCVLRAGIALTRDDDGTGMFGVVAGTHRANISANPAGLPPELPKLDLRCDPGDVHVHLSCTFHRGTPPTTSARRVLYNDFLLPGLDRQEVERQSAYRGGTIGKAVGEAVATAARSAG